MENGGRPEVQIPYGVSHPGSVPAEAEVDVTSRYASASSPADQITQSTPDKGYSEPGADVFETNDASKGDYERRIRGAERSNSIDLA